MRYLMHFQTVACMTLAAALFITTSCKDGQATSRVREVAKSVTAGDFCQVEKITTVDREFDPAKSSFMNAWVSANPDACTTWPNQIANVEILSGQVDIANSRIPLLFYANQAVFEKHRSVERIIIRTVGGPASAIGPYGFESAYISNPSVPTVMIALGYSGTSHNSNYPEENFNAAVDQISKYVTMLCHRTPNASVLMIGESLGGPITVSAAQKVSGCDGRLRELLVSPMVDSPSDQIKYTDLSHSTNQRSGKKFAIIKGNPTVAPARELFATFFPEDQKSWSLDYRIGRGKPPQDRIWFIFGSDDPILNEETVLQLARKHRDRTTVLNGMRHVSDPGFEDDIAAVVESIFSEDLRR